MSSEVSTFFIKNPLEYITFKNETIENIRYKLNDFDSLSVEDVDSICLILKSLKDDPQRVEKIV